MDQKKTVSIEFETVLIFYPRPAGFLIGAGRGFGVGAGGLGFGFGAAGRGFGLNTGAGFDTGAGFGVDGRVVGCDGSG
jgi:hypothetical protein